MNPDIPSPGQHERNDIKEPILTPKEMREKLRDPGYVPSYGELSNALKRLNRSHGEYNDPERKQWRTLVSDSEHPIFEFWTKEYIHAFGTYLANRVEELGGSTEHPVVILEIGAGNGRLAHFLQEKMNELIPGKLVVVATDSDERKIVPDYPVETLPHNEALNKYKPNIIIFSWMPTDEDFTADFRATDSVDEYILIGEPDSGINGDPWKTWGKPDYSAEGEERERQEHGPTSYEADGFEKEYLNDMSDFQLSRLKVLEGSDTTQTVSFKRGKQPTAIDKIAPLR